MKLTTALLAAALAAACALPAYAETFSLTGTSTRGATVAGVAPDGTQVVSLMSTGVADLVTDGTKKSKTTTTCSTWTAEPGSVFATRAVCNGKDADGAENSVVLGCINTNAAKTESTCWGPMTGVSGRLAKKTGSITFHVKQSADGKTSTIVGAGFWN
jgi:hypothetical protein